MLGIRGHVSRIQCAWCARRETFKPEEMKQRLPELALPAEIEGPKQVSVFTLQGLGFIKRYAAVYVFCM